MKIGRVLVVFLLATASSLSQALTATTTTISSSLDPSFTAGGELYGGGHFEAWHHASGWRNRYVRVSRNRTRNSTIECGFGYSRDLDARGCTDYVKAVYAGDSTFGEARRRR